MVVLVESKHNDVGRAFEDRRQQSISRFKLRQYLLPFRNVAGNPQNSDQFTIRVVHGGFNGVEQRTVPVVGKSDPLFVVRWATFFHGDLIVFSKGIGQLVINKVVVGFADNFVTCGSQKTLEHGIAREENAICVF